MAIFGEMDSDHLKGAGSLIIIYLLLLRMLQVLHSKMLTHALQNGKTI